MKGLAFIGKGGIGPFPITTLKRFRMASSNSERGDYFLERSSRRNNPAPGG